MQLEQFVDYLESLKLYRQSRVNRWQLRDYVFTQNDAEHQLYVTQIIVILTKTFEIPDSIALKALSYGCCHDYVESTEDSFGDVNYMLKEKNPELKRLVKEQERKSMQNVNAFYQTLIECESDKISKLVVELADSIEALLYDRREIKFNVVKDEWLQIQNELMERITRCWNELTTYKNNNFCL